MDQLLSSRSIEATRALRVRDWVGSLDSLIQCYDIHRDDIWITHVRGYSLNESTDRDMKFALDLEEYKELSRDPRWPASLTESLSARLTDQTHSNPPVPSVSLQQINMQSVKPLWGDPARALKVAQSDSVSRTIATRGRTHSKPACGSTQVSATARLPEDPPAASNTTNPTQSVQSTESILSHYQAILQGWIRKNDFICVVESLGYKGVALPPMMIGEATKPVRTSDTSKQEPWAEGVASYESATGWLEHDTLWWWMVRIFQPRTKPRVGWRLLLVDKDVWELYDTHGQVKAFCHENRILVLDIPQPGDATTQPAAHRHQFFNLLNTPPLSGLRSSYSQAALKYIRGNRISSSCFGHPRAALFYSEARRQHLTKQNIMRAFFEVGVLDKERWPSGTGRETGMMSCRDCLVNCASIRVLESHGMGYKTRVASGKEPDAGEAAAADDDEVDAADDGEVGTADDGEAAAADDDEVDAADDGEAAAADDDEESCFDAALGYREDDLPAMQEGWVSRKRKFNSSSSHQIRSQRTRIESDIVIGNQMLGEFDSCDLASPMFAHWLGMDRYNALFIDK